MCDDWPIRMGENRPDRVPKHLAAKLLGARLAGQNKPLHNSNSRSTLACGLKVKR